MVVLTAIGIMIGIKAAEQREALPVADGKVGEVWLPMDRDTARVKFRIATFGLG